MSKTYIVIANRLGETVEHQFDGTFKEASSRAVFEEYKNRKGENWTNLHLLVDECNECRTIEKWVSEYV